MKYKNFNKVLTIILIAITVAVFIIIGFWCFDIFQKAYIDSGANKAIDEFDQLIQNANNDNGGENSNSQENISNQSDDENSDSYTGNGSSSGRRTRNGRSVSYQYNGFNVVGKIEIPRINLKYPVYDVATVTSMKSSVGIIYGPGLNEVGNTVIMGHNYRNGTFFSNNKRLSTGDVIYITDSSGLTIEYTIYNTYTTSSSDFEYAVRDTAGKREITLASCTDDSKSRLIIWAKED